MILSSSAHAADIVSGLVGWWRFDETSGTTARDASGKGNTGTLNNFAGPATATSGWASGNFDGALSFDGVDDNTTATSSSSLSFGSGDFTVSFWTYRTALGYQGGSYIRKALNNSSPGFDTYDGGFYVRTSAGALAKVACNPTFNVWQSHIFVVTQESAPYIKHYINGVLNQASYVESGAKGSINNTQPLTIGFSRAGAVNRYFNGSMDEVRIYNRALTAEDVLKLYNNGGPTTIRNATISNVVIE